MSQMPTSGTINFDELNTVLGRAVGATTSLGESATRTLAGVPTGAISLASLYGKSNITYSNIDSTINNVSAAQGIRSASFGIESNGSTYTTPWATSSSTIDGSTYTVVISLDSSTNAILTGASMGTVYSLASTVVFGIQNSGNIVEGTATFSFTIKNNAGIVVSTGTVNFNVGYTGA